MQLHLLSIISFTVSLVLLAMGLEYQVTSLKVVAALGLVYALWAHTETCRTIRRKHRCVVTRIR